MNNDKVKLIATKKLRRYGNKKLIEGEEFEAMSQTHARLLIATGQAIIPPALTKAAKRKYKTRDLEAETAEAEAEVKSEYRRLDVEPE